MTVYRHNTKELSIKNAQDFIGSLSAEDSATQKNSTVLYVTLGKTSEWDDEPTPSNPEKTDQYLHYDIQRNFIGGKKVDPTDLSHVIPRYNWASGTVYSMYRDTDREMYVRRFYVMTDQLNVYKCLYNNKGEASTVKPTGFSTLPFTTSDGYTWKYMYTISLSDSMKFMTPSYIPVKDIDDTDSSVEQDRQYDVKLAAVNGAIHIVETVNGGVGYSSVFGGQVVAATSTTLQLSSSIGNTTPSATDNEYNGSSVYILSGTGAGQLKRIVDYSGTTKTLVVNNAFSVVPGIGATVVISPTVTIVGDGVSAKAYAIVNNSTGLVSNVSVIDVGENYTRAKVYISSNTNHGYGATANAIVSPIGGHGHNPVKELGGDRVILNVKFQGTEGISANGNGYIPSNTEFRVIGLLKDPVLKVDANNNHTTTEHVANSSNSPSTLRLTSRMVISYNDMDGVTPINPLSVGDVLTNERNRLKAELGTLEFVTLLGESEREAASLQNAVQAANGQIVYIREDETEADASFYTIYLNNVNSFSDYPAFTKDDVILTSESDAAVGTVESIKGPEANTYSGEILYVEHVQKITKDLSQLEDIKIVLNF